MSQGNPRLTRRRFLQGAGITAASGAALDGCKPTEVAKGVVPTEVLGPARVPVTLQINGRSRKLAIEPRSTLAEALRDELGMTGTKLVCNRGSCSACTVWLDDTPVNSCTVFALDAVGRRVTTIEGLATPQGLHPVQRAFVAHDAAQCGFCTPGMVMSCAALLRRNPSPSIDDVKRAVSGNLCRCGTYANVMTATLAASRRG